MFYFIFLIYKQVNNLQTFSCLGDDEKKLMEMCISQ